jgi:NAD(P)-dependent dehydrogenase (short-subunit alcohol dehydrogenase family)
MAGDLQGRVFLVTGATEGIGKAAALEFARRGAAMTLVGRSREKTERVLGELRAASGNADMQMLLGDLSTLADVRRVAEQFRARHEHLDVLVNNAGAVFTERGVSADGFEMTFALNHLSYFLLTTLLLDLLKKAPGARVVSTSSGAHEMGKMNLGDIARRERGYSAYGAYGDSKLANVLFTRELARRLEGTGVTANCIHPGWVSTGFGLNNRGLGAKVLKVVAPIFARRPEKGAETLIWLATSPEATSFNGEYFHDKKVAKISKLARNPELAEQLWDLSERLCTSAASASAQAS